MSGDRSLALALGVAAVLAIVAFPLLGWFGSLPAAATAFYVVALIGSGHRRDRVFAWGAITGGLFALGMLAAAPVAPVAYAAGAGFFVAGVLVPAFRSRWFGGIAD